MSKRLLLLSLLMSVAVAASAINPHRVKRIDRGIHERVFIPKGQWMVGGTISYSEHDEDNLNFLVLKNVEGLGYDFKVSPYVGYFFRDNMSAGIRFAYNRT